MEGVQAHCDFIRRDSRGTARSLNEKEGVWRLYHLSRSPKHILKAFRIGRSCTIVLLNPKTSVLAESRTLREVLLIVKMLATWMALDMAMPTGYSKIQRHTQWVSCPKDASVFLKTQANQVISLMAAQGCACRAWAPLVVAASNLHWLL